tara:strand:- start:300 stop:974 length:675 start_codon:yes stop_codon:yes gene_type:complete
LIDQNILKKVHQNIAKAIKKRQQDNVTIIAVTKGFPFSAIQDAEKSGLYNIGESRVQETEKKQHAITNKITTHFIGRLQKNKVKKAIQLYDVIQTVHSIELAKKINHISLQKQKKQKIFLQINIGMDINKQGFNPKKTVEAAHEISKLQGIEICGVMMIPPYQEINTEYRAFHKRTKNIQLELYTQGIKTCKSVSMGMSRDYKIAIEEGATHIRLGTKLFGARQ